MYGVDERGGSFFEKLLVIVNLKFCSVDVYIRVDEQET
jgi:hypothetical protein